MNNIWIVPKYLFDFIIIITRDPQASGVADVIFKF